MLADPSILALRAHSGRAASVSNHAGFLLQYFLELDLIFKVGVNQDLYLAIEDAKNVSSKMKRQETVAYLQGLEEQLKI